MKKSTLLSIFIASAFIIAGIFLVGYRSKSVDANPTNQNVYIEDGKQIIEISARNGYSPSNTTAKANIPTVIRMETTGTFSCASSLVIPKLSYRGNLPPTGTVDIPVDPQKSGSEITGLCSMGMYNFSIKFI